MRYSHEELVDAQFGSRAHNYVQSEVHAAGNDLVRIGEIAREGFAAALDLGCGGGHVSYALAPHGERVVACDLSAAMLEVVGEQLQLRHLANVELHRAAAERLPFAEAAFDLLVSRYSVHHWRDWETGLREARRVTREGGRIVFADVMAPAAGQLDTHLQAIEVLRDPSHVRDRSMEEWIAALGRAGIATNVIRTARLAIDFASWVDRMATPDPVCRTIRWLQSGAAIEVRRAFEITEDGSFTVDTIFIEGTAIAT